MVFIPPQPDVKTLVSQADTILPAEACGGGEQLPYGASTPVLRTS